MLVLYLYMYMYVCVLFDLAISACLYNFWLLFVLVKLLVCYGSYILINIILIFLSVVVNLIKLIICSVCDFDLPYFLEISPW